MTITHWALVTVVIFLFGRIEYSSGQNIQKCEYDSDSCGCKTDQGLIDLTKFKDDKFSAPGSMGEQYFWNPCRDFTIMDITSACMQSYPTSTYDCGTHKSTTSSVEDGTAVFHLKADIESRKSNIKCVCGTSGKFTFITESPTGTYNLELNDKACCPIGGSTAGSSHGLSGGSILLIVALVVVVVYLVGGVIIQVGVRKVEGKERIPNVNFWTALPGLIKDGFRFTFSGFRSGAYSQI
ncbi:cation-dependent mannose-6-phosphate receptor [Plakobranchus ocellatus]|uniref:Cation-dependent mannose-6-phosphate receptor n=1 Tax=Plakobranchus ocellatus TaxID=259542 RepID=A0AAV3Z133_9GAST|nr:cation-dependent mannose-6-phosphate receptor [Plakobranchus ocellatus]